MIESWRMFAHKTERGDYQHFGVEWWVELHGLSQPVVEVEVSLADESAEDAYWGWVDAANEPGTRPEMIWRHRDIFGMQFTYGVQVEIKAGKGQAVALTVREVTGV